MASVAQGPSRRKQNAVRKEETQPLDKQHHRKQYNVTWIGRGVWKFTETGKDYLEEWSKGEVIGLKEDVINDEHAVFSGDTDEDIHLEGLKQREAKGVVVEELKRCNQEDRRDDVVKQQNLQQELLMIKRSENIQLSNQQEREGKELEVEVAEKSQLKEQLESEVLQETLQLKDNVMEHDLLNVRSEVQEDGCIQEWNEQQKQVEGASVDQSGSKLQQIDSTREHADLQEQSMVEADDTSRLCGKLQRGSMEQQQLEERGVEPGELIDEVSEEHNLEMIQCEAQIRGTSVETESDENHDNFIEEQIEPQVQSTEAKVEYVSRGQHNRVSIEQEMVQEQVEMAGETHQHEERKGEKIQKERVLMKEDTKEPKEPAVVQTEAQVTGVNLVPKMLEEKLDEVAEEQVQPQAHCMESTQELLTEQQHREIIGQEMQEKQVKMSGEPNEVDQKERLLMDKDTEEQGVVMTQGETQLRDASVEQNEAEEQEGPKEEVWPYEKQEIGRNEKEVLGRQVKMICEPHQIEERQTEGQVNGECLEQNESEEHQCGEICIEISGSSDSTFKGPGPFPLESPDVEKLYLSHHHNRDEERQPSRQGLRSRYKKQEENLKAEVTPVRRSPRLGKTNLEAARATEEVTQKECVWMDGDTLEPQNAILIQSKTQERGASMLLNELKEQHCDATEELIQPQEQHVEGIDKKFQLQGHDKVKDGEIKPAEEQPQQGGQQSEVSRKEFLVVKEITDMQEHAPVQSEGRVTGECPEKIESEEHQCVTGKHFGLQEDFREGRKDEFQLHRQKGDILEQVQLGREVEIRGGGHQQEQPSEMKEQHNGLVNRVSDIQEGLVMVQSKPQIAGASVEHNESEMHQDQLEERDVEIAENQPEQEVQDNKVLQKEIVIMNDLTEVTEDSMKTRPEAQVEGTNVKLNESEGQQTYTTAGRVTSLELFMEEAKEEKRAIEKSNGQQNIEKEAILEKVQKEECENRDEQRHPLRQGLGFGNKKQKGNPNAEVTPVRRSPRLFKTNLEEATATEDVDCSGGPPKKKHKNAAA